jgi:hypothetical protein
VRLAAAGADPAAEILTLLDRLKPDRSLAAARRKRRPVRAARAAENR